jgi:hypothetical protein
MLLDTQVCFRVLPVCTLCTALAWPADNAKITSILDTQQCKTIMTLSNHKGRQIIRDTIRKCFLQDFLTITTKKLKAYKISLYKISYIHSTLSNNLVQTNLLLHDVSVTVLG